MEETGIVTKIIVAILIAMFAAIFILMIVSCSGTCGAFGYNGPMVIPGGGGIMILP